MAKIDWKAVHELNMRTMPYYAIVDRHLDWKKIGDEAIAELSRRDGKQLVWKDGKLGCWE